MNSYFNGQKVRSSVVFTVAAVSTDPTVVTFKVRTPAGVTTTSILGGSGSPVTKDSTGHYHADISTTSVGEWLVRWEGTGTCEAVEEDSFLISTRFG